MVVLGLGFLLETFEEFGDYAQTPIGFTILGIGISSLSFRVRRLHDVRSYERAYFLDPVYQKFVADKNEIESYFRKHDFVTEMLSRLLLNLGQQSGSVVTVSFFFGKLQENYILTLTV